MQELQVCFLPPMLTLCLILIHHYRRKKARCPAERPICSFCKRLNQVCEYDGPPVQEQPAKSISQSKSLKLAERVAELESRIAMLTDTNDG